VKGGENSRRIEREREREERERERRELNIVEEFLNETTARSPHRLLQNMTPSRLTTGPQYNELLSFGGRICTEMQPSRHLG
jgi:hypothetical protein